MGKQPYIFLGAHGLCEFSISNAPCLLHQPLALLTTVDTVRAAPRSTALFVELKRVQRKHIGHQERA